MIRIYSLIPMLAGCVVDLDRSVQKRASVFDLEHGGPPTYAVTEYPPEFRDVDRVFFQSDVYEPVVGQPTTGVHETAMAALLRHGVTVELLVNDPSEADAFETDLRALGVTSHELLDFETVELPLDAELGINHSDAFGFDTGPVRVRVRKSGAHRDQDGILDLTFGGWGYGPESDADSRALYAVDDQIATKYAAEKHLPAVASWLAGEGGLVTNGAGTAIYSLPAFLQDNPGKTQTDIELEIERVTHTTATIAVPVCVPSDAFAFVSPGNLYPGLGADGSDLHVGFGVCNLDTKSIPYSETGILVPDYPAADVTPGNAIEQACYDADQAIQAFWSAQPGWTVTLVPDPCVVPYEVTPSVGGPFEQGDSVADVLSWLIPDSSAFGITQTFSISGLASYLPLIAADAGGCEQPVVLIPSFWEPGLPTRLQTTDAEAVTAIQSAWPDAEIVQIPTGPIAVNGGGLR